MTTASRTVERVVDFGRRGRGARKELFIAAAATPPEQGRVPHVARLMALAIRFDDLLRAGAVRDYAELARLHQVSRARLTQVMNLLLLAPDIQEELLFLAPARLRRAPATLARLQPVAREPDWHKQRRLWRAILDCANAIRKIPRQPLEVFPPLR